MQEVSNREYHVSQDRMALLPNYYNWIYQQFADSVDGVVAELGAGAGHLLRYYVHRAERVVAVDYNEILLARMQAAYPASDLTVVKQDLRIPWMALDSGSVDTVIALDVLEHFENEGFFISEIRRILKPGGKAILKVPAQSSLFSQVDIASGHYRRYDLQALELLMKSSGFEVCTQRHFNTIGAVLYRTRAKEKDTFSRSVSPVLLKLANACIPLFAFVDKISRLKGLSIIGVYRLS